MPQAVPGVLVEAFSPRSPPEQGPTRFQWTPCQTGAAFLSHHDPSTQIISFGLIESCPIVSAAFIQMIQSIDIAENGPSKGWGPKSKIHRLWMFAV